MLTERKERKTHYRKCPKCGQRKELDAFPKSGGTICKTCRNLKNKEFRNRNISFRLRHHMATRVETQLKALSQPRPTNLVGGIEKWLGYSIRQLKQHLKEDLLTREDISLSEAFRRGYHVDHIKPLSAFNITSIEDEEFRACWHFTNLRVISAAENLAKGATYDPSSSPSEMQPEGIN